MAKFKAGDTVEVRSIPWRGFIGTYVARGRVAGIFPCHKVQLGDRYSGGSPRIVKVTKVRRVEGEDDERGSTLE